MFSVLATHLTYLLTTYGYWAVLVFVCIESTGIPFPGETMLLFAAIYTGTTHQLSLVLVIIAAASGAIMGDNFGFWIGRKGGYQLLRRYGPALHLNERKLKLGQYLFMKHGGKVVFFGRFVAVLRVWTAFLAGTNRMRWTAFLLFNALGGIVWATLYGLGGYLLGDNIHRLTGPVAFITIALAILAFIAVLLYVRRHEQQLEAEAERALPDSLDVKSLQQHKGQAPRVIIHPRESSQEEISPTLSAQSKRNFPVDSSIDRTEPERENAHEAEQVFKI
ncbi:MAG TPA: DedA family protein [Ktedonobacteraceae bacterium]|jgi:membrane protein DedA with SNARE-associated domain|nr:DedA family protein [Ktedonobacteraceae bacterium]